MNKIIDTTGILRLLNLVSDSWFTDFGAKAIATKVLNDYSSIYN